MELRSSKFTVPDDAPAHAGRTPLDAESERQVDGQYEYLHARPGAAHTG